MPPSEMEDGLEVNIDEFFGEGSTSIPSFEDGEGFSWADDFISSATGAFADRPSAAITTTTNVLSSSIAQVSQNSIPQNVPNQQQIAVSASQMGQTTFIQQQQQQFSMVNLQPQLQGTGGLLHGCSFRHAKYRKKGFHSVPQYIIKSTTAGPIQSQQQTQIQQPRSSPAPSSYSANSPLTSRTVTPSCSPAPAMSPLVSRSITPIQTQSAIVTANTSRPPSHSSSPAPNILQFNQNNLQARPQVQLANTVPIQGFIQSSPNTSIISGQNTLTPNIVHTQNAVIQNPNVVNLNVAHVLCNNNQTMGQQNVQNLPATMQNPMNIQGTIIQTANGKSILIPNNNIQGQQINLAGMQNISVGHPNTIGQPMIQNQQNLGNVIRLAPQQDKQPSVAQPNYSFVSVGNQGQQIFLQRAPNPGQPQNIILRSVPQNVILQPQGQGQTTGKQPTPIQPHQIPQQIPQQIVNQQPHQNIQFQQVFTGAGQPMKIVTQGGGQVGSQSGAVTLNLAGQNLNLQQLAGLGIGTNNLQGLQFGNGGQFILQPQQQQQQQQQQIFQTVPKINPQPTTATPTAAVDPLTQALSMSGITENGSHFNEPTLVQTPPPEIVKKLSKKAKKVEADRTQIPQMSVQVQPIASSASTNVQSSLSQLMATAASVAGISSNCSGPVGFNTVFSTAQGTVVTTTISQSFVQTPSSLSIVTNSIGGQIINTGSQLNTSNILSTSQIKGQVFGHQGVAVNQTTPTQSNQQMSNDAKHIQRIDTEIKRLMSLKSMTADQKREVQQMSVLQKKLMAANQNQHLKNINQSSSSSQMVGQPAIAQPQVVQPGQTPILQISNPISHTHQQAPVQHVIQSVQNIQSSSNSIFHNTPQQQQTSGVVQFTLAQSQPTTTLLSSTSQVIIQPSTSLNKNIPHTRNVQIQPGPIMSTGSAMSSVPAGKLPITAIPAMPTQIKFGNQMLTLNLTPQQKEKLQMHLSKMTIEQQEQFLKHQSTLKLQQKQQQIQALQKQAAAQQQQAQTSSLPALLTSGTKMPQTVNNSGGGTPVKTEPGQQTTLNRGGKVVSTEIPKASLIHQQMSKDQQNAVAPDTKAPFKNSREACRRLLRYHVFQWSGPSKQEYERADCMLEQRSADLLNKSRTMMDKYRLLLLNDSMRQNPSAEMVMIQRMLQQDLTACIKEEKRQIQEDPESFQPMPLKFLKIKESTSDQSFEENKSVKKESSFEEETSVHDTSEESDQNVAIPFDKSAPVFKSSPSSGTMKLLIRKQSQGFVSSLASEGSDSPKPSSPLVSVKMEPVDSNFEIRSSKYSKSGSSDTCDSVYSKSLTGLASDMSYPKAKIKSEPHTSDPKNPLHIHIDSDVEVNHDASFQHSDESYEDYKDSVLISRDMSNMSHTDVSDASMTEDLHAEFDRTISSPIGQSYQNPRHHESKSVNDMPLSIGENLTESICNDRTGRERGDIVDSVESGTYSSISPSQYHSGLGIVGNNVNDDDIYLPCSSVGQGQTSNVDVSSRTFCSSDSVLTRTNSLSNELMSVDPNEIQSLNNRPLSSYSVSSYHRQISSAEVSEFESNDFNTSFGSDSVTEPQNSLLSNQMQSAIDSILDNEQEQDQDETADDYLPDQSNSLNSQDVSEDDFDEEEDASMEEYSPKPQWSKGDNSDIEDDDDEDSAAVKSILM